MTKVLLEDAQTVTTLDALKQRAELCDSQGRVLGYYVPSELETPKIYRGIKSPLSKEERERILREEIDRAKPLSESWEDMKRKYPNKLR